MSLSVKASDYKTNKNGKMKASNFALVWRTQIPYGCEKLKYISYSAQPEWDDRSYTISCTQCHSALRHVLLNLCLSLENTDHLL
jgi:hypothetical protein